MNSLEGHFLIASPHLPDVNFAQSVVLMIEHHAEGALGVILNRPTKLTLRELWRQVEENAIETDQMIANQNVSLGGPVQGPVVSLHARVALSESEVLPGVHIATRREHIRQLILDNQQPFRIFTGYSGWGAGQLESELDVGGWLTVAGTADLVFSDEPTELWQRALQMTGREFFERTLGIRGFPGDASLN